MADDELMLLAAKDGNYSALLHTGAARKAGTAVVNLPQGMESAQAVYLSFASERRGMYSEDQYFLL